MIIKIGDWQLKIGGKKVEVKGDSIKVDGKPIDIPDPEKPKATSAIPTDFPPPKSGALNDSLRSKYQQAEPEPKPTFEQMDDSLKYIQDYVKATIKNVDDWGNRVNVTVNGQKVGGGKCYQVTIISENDLQEVKADGSVTVQGNVGEIDCGGSVSVSGNAGDIDCGGSATVGGNTGDIDAGGSVRTGR
jgi:hypothetical protein